MRYLNPLKEADMSKGRFGIHGGQYIPETLMNAVIELEEAYNRYKDDPDFKKELSALFLVINVNIKIALSQVINFSLIEIINYVL